MENDIKKFINLVMSEDFVKAKDTISDLLNQKLSGSLATKFDEYAPTMFEAAKPDFLDLDKDGDTQEPMKQAARQAEEGDAEDVDEDEKQSEEEEESETEDEDSEEDSEEDEEDEEEED